MPKSQQRRNLNIVATATPLSRQFTSVPGFSQIGEPVRILNPSDCSVLTCAYFLCFRAEICMNFLDVQVPEGLLLSEVVKSLPKEVKTYNMDMVLLQYNILG